MGHILSSVPSVLKTWLILLSVTAPYALKNLPTPSPQHCTSKLKSSSFCISFSIIYFLRNSSHLLSKQVGPIGGMGSPKQKHSNLFLPASQTASASLQIYRRTALGACISHSYQLQYCGRTYIQKNVEVTCLAFQQAVLKPPVLPFLNGLNGFIPK